MSAPRLTAEQKSRIVAAWEAGENGPSIAMRFGVHESYPMLLAKRRRLKVQKQKDAALDAVQ